MRERRKGKIEKRGERDRERDRVREGEREIWTRGKRVDKHYHNSLE